MNIYEKIQAVSEEIKNVEKNLTISAGQSSYKAVSEKDVLNAVKKAEVKFKIISIPYKQEIIKQEVIESVNKYNNTIITLIDTIKMTTKIINLEDTTEAIEIETLAKGVDTQDKGLGKASTYARKYALLNAYKIITGEDPDEHISEPMSRKTTPQAEQKPQGNKYIGKAEIDQLTAINLPNEIAKGIIKSFNIASSKEIPKDKFEKVLQAFKDTKEIQNEIGITEE